MLTVTDLHTYFFTKQGVGRAVNGVSFSLQRGETLGLVGESGSGKSLVALSIVGLNPRPASKVVRGRVVFKGEELLKKSQREMSSYRGRHIAMILQDPLSALNPVFTIRDQLEESLRLHRALQGDELHRSAVQLLDKLRLPDSRRRLDSYPHQLSGGMRQRVVGAIAISSMPEVLIADEPTTSLDVTVQAAYLTLLKELQRESGIAILFITHDFSVVARMCDRVAVMYAGRIVETGPTEQVLNRPAHPYTEALLNSVPSIEVTADDLPVIQGSPPSIFEPAVGCSFAPRCPYVEPRNTRETPPLVEAETDHLVSCWRHAPR